MVNTYDTQGGAARAAYRFHKGLQIIGVDSKMLVQNKISSDSSVISSKTKFERMAALIRPRLDKLPVNRYQGKTKTLFSPSWVPFSKIAEIINNAKPDIVHFHWIAGGMLSIEDLVKVKVPIVWSLHDMWAFTGGCHTDNYCGRHSTQCGACPVLGSNKEKDLSYSVFKRKQKIYEKIENITIVGLSKWMAKLAKQSTLLKNKPVINLPNLIDTNIYKPLDKKMAREALNIPNRGKIILYGAMGATNNPNKGFEKLLEVINLLDQRDVCLIVFGSGKPEVAPVVKFPTHYLGRLYDDLSLRVLFSAVDVVVVPSMQENLSNVIMESMACGTPVVAFNVGGNPDLIDHKQNGYLARPYEAADLAQGIKYVLEHGSLDILGNSAVQKIQDCFEMGKVALRYHQLYQEVISNNRL